MALEPIPSDPRTWTDFADPASRGFLKIDCNTAREGALSGGALALAAVAAIWAGCAFDPAHVPAPLRLSPAALDPRGPILLGCGAAALFGLRLMTDDFYLVDKSRQAVVLRSQVGFWRRVRLIVERKDIVAVSVQTRWRTDSADYFFIWDWDTPASRTWWEQRVVLVDRRGRVVPFGDWARDSLWAANNEAREVATMLACRCFEMPEQAALVVTRSRGEVSVAFGAAAWHRQPGAGSWLTLVVSFILASVFGLLFAWW
jgi:hypothetical protein